MDISYLFPRHRVVQEVSQALKAGSIGVQTHPRRCADILGGIRPRMSKDIINPWRSRVVMAGPPGCGRIVMLFHFALHIVNTTKEELCFVAPQKEMESMVPILHKIAYGVADEVLARIHFVYCDTGAEVRRFAGRLHLTPPGGQPPTCIIVEGLSKMFDKESGGQSGVLFARTVAMLSEACIWSTSARRSALSAPNETLLVMGDGLSRSGECVRYVEVYERWCPVTLMVEELEQVEMDRRFVLHVCETKRDGSERKPLAEYIVERKGEVICEKLL